MTDPTTLRIEIRDSVATVTLCRPEVHNAFNETVIAELTESFRALAENAEVRVIVLAGEGKSFSAGADLNWMKSMAGYTFDENVEDARAMARMFRAIDRSPKPVIARVQGAALGGGAGLVAVSDIPVATETSRFAFSEVRLGIIPAVISPYVVARIGAGHARELFLTGERFDGKRAADIGLVAHVVPEAELDAKVGHLTEQILACGPQAVSAAKDLIFTVSAERDADACLDETARRIAERRTSDEGQDGMHAFLDKRPPRWIAK